MDFDEKIRLVEAQIQTARTKMNFQNPIYLSVDEWGAFGRSFMNVLPIAECLNSFVRHADEVKMANFTMATSLLSSDPKKGTYKSPVFYTFKLFSNNCLGKSVDTYVECDTFSTALYKNIKVLDATTVYSKDNNTVFINVINKSEDKAITTDIINNSGDFSGKAEASVVSSDVLKAPFSIDKQSQYVPVTKDVKLNGNKLSFTFPPHSFTQIKVSVASK
jgi:alpha-N-arabinofuranosidase